MSLRPHWFTLARLAFLGGAGVCLFGVASACSTSKESQPGLTREALLDPQSCAGCHPNQMREWAGSMHAYAAEDPVFIAMNRRGQRETKGELGAFCVSCHAPMAVREGKTTDGLNLAELDPRYRGVTCYFCHAVDAVEGTHNNPLRLAGDGVMRGAFGSPLENTAHASGYSSLHDRDHIDSSSLCGACHDIETNHGAFIERTFSEWKESVFSKVPGGATCSQCHMEQSTEMRPVAEVPGAPLRRTHAHDFPAVDVAITDFPEKSAQRRRVQDFLNTTLQSALCVIRSGDTFGVRVILDNVAAGHGFPSGSAQDRRLWTEVIATQNGDVVYESGRIADGEAIVNKSDPDLWLLRDCMLGDRGQHVEMFWEAYSYETNQLPAQKTFDPLDPRFYQTHIVQTFPRAGFVSGAPDKVTLRVRLEPIGRDVLEHLVASGDLDAKFMAEMPIFDLGVAPILEWTAAAATDQYFEENVPVTCVTKTALDVTTDKVRAPSRATCKP